MWSGRRSTTGPWNTDLDEALVSFYLDDWGITAGHLFVPFGEYNSYFVTGPALDFAETQDNALVVDYSFTDAVNVSGFVFKGDVDRQGRSNETDWGLAAEIQTEAEFVNFGASYISDITEARDFYFREEADFYLRRVPAWSAYLLFGFDRFEFTAETVQATRKFKEFESNLDKPVSYNFELTWFPWEWVQVTTRLENNRELMDEPKWRYGVSSTMRLAGNVSFSVDYLYGRYERDFVFDDVGNELEYAHQLAALLSIEF